MSLSLSDKIKQLRKAFLDKMPVTIADLQQLCDSLERDGYENSRVDTLCRGFHTLKGGAASFGLQEISSEAKQAELLADQLKDSDLSRWQEIRGAVLAPLIEHLKQLERLCLDYLQQEHAENDQAKANALEPGFDMEQSQAVEKASRNKIYLCDDDENQAEKLALQIANFGYDLTIFSDPSCLEIAIQQAMPDAILMDIAFPDGASTGTSVIADLVKNSGLNIPVVFLSARGDFDARLQAVQAGGAAYLEKPVKMNEMVEALDRLTKQEAEDPLRILIVDDDTEVAAYHSFILEQAGMITHHLTLPDSILQVLPEFSPDLILMDMYMPRCSGRELSCVIRQIGRFVSLPIIYLSSETDRDKQLSALQTVGAEGFLTKPVKPDELVSSVAIRAERMRVLRSLMVRDSLTGLFNHTFIAQFLTKTRAEAERTGDNFCVAMLDIDHFKSVNDTFGHPAGDQVLIALSRLLQQRLRSADLVGRYGGEEFALILRNVGLAEGMNIVDGLRRDFNKIRFQFMDKEVFCSFSAGIAQYPDFSSDALLMKAADQALYTAKNQGRNRIFPANPNAAAAIL